MLAVNASPAVPLGGNRRRIGEAVRQTARDMEGMEPGVGLTHTV